MRAGEFHDAAPEFAPAPYENTFTNARGERLVIEWRSAPITDAAGNVTSIVAGGIDITERKQREVQLQRERDITETLMQAIPSLVVVVDTDGVVVDSGVDETRAGVNNAFRQALGWPDSAIVRRSVLDLIDPADSYLALMAIASAANGVPAHERESRWLRADGSRIVVAWTATPVDDVTGRRASLVLLSGVDVTERKQHEEEIRASRSRIVAAADEARRKLERNLHDGAQQRLVALSVSLRLAEGKLHDDPDGARAILSAAREELAAALDELRELARGIHPAVLTDRGLRAAIEAMLTRFPLPVELELPDERLPAPVEAAAYYVISEALTNVVKYAGRIRRGGARHRERRAGDRGGLRRRRRRRRSRARHRAARARRPCRGAGRGAPRREPGGRRDAGRGRPPGPPIGAGWVVGRAHRSLRGGANRTSRHQHAGLPRAPAPCECPCINRPTHEGGSQ